MDLPQPRPRLLDSLFFVLLLSGPPKLRGRDPTASLRGEVDTAALIQIAIWVAAAALILWRLYPLLIVRGKLPRLWWPQALGGALVLSLCLALPYAPGVLLSGFSIMQFAVMLGFAYIFARMYGVQSYLKHLFAGYVLMTLFVIGAWVLSPDLVVAGGRVRGDAVAPAGAVAVMALTLCWSATPRLRAWMIGAMTAIAGIVLAFSQTRTAFIGLAAFLALGIFVGGGLPVRRMLPYALVGMIVIALFDALGAAEQFVVRERDSIVTMSDRIPLWKYTVTATMQESPILGLGYYSASRVLGPQYNPALGNAHSAFVEVLIGGGLLGFLLFVLLFGVMLTGSIRLALQHPGRPVPLALAGLTVLVLLNSITGSEGINAGPVGFTFWSLTALIPLSRQTLMSTQDATLPVPRRTLSARVPLVSAGSR